MSEERYLHQQAEWIQAACLAEASAPKPGNVHPQASFCDLSYEDFVLSAKVASPWLARAGQLGVGPAIRKAVLVTQQTVGTNTNLGIALLMAPLAAVPLEQTLSQGISRVLETLTLKDSQALYEAIRMARPGGLGSSAQQDVGQEPTLVLKEVMAIAAERDRIARQYVTDFSDLLGPGMTLLHQARQRFPNDWHEIIVHLQLRLLAQWPDSLIQRKCGAAAAEEVMARAQCLLSRAGEPPKCRDDSLRQWDQWLRRDGHRYNPGTTADLIAALLYIALREGHVSTEELMAVAVSVGNRSD